MNIRENSAGYVTGKYIESRGFEVFDTIEGNDMGQMTYFLPQYKNDKCKILGGYWNYVVKDLDDNTIWEGWWNSNEEFDETMTDLGVT